MLGITRGWKENLFAIEFIANILEDFKGALGALSVDQRFDPNNDGFLLMFQSFVYPLLWIGST